MRETTSISASQLENQLRLKQLEVNSLLEVIQAINNNLSVDKLLRIYEFILRAQMQVSKMAIYYNVGKEVEPYFSFGLSPTEGLDEFDIRLEMSKYKRLTDLSVAGLTPYGDLQIIIPITHQDKQTSYVLMSTPIALSKENYDDKLGIIQIISNIIVVAIENRRLQEREIEQERLNRDLELAAQMQVQLIPDELPNNDAYEMAAIYQPHRNIGGDYYDVVRLDDGRICFCIADIAGKGVSAALLMANFQATLRALVHTAHDFERFIFNLNKRMLEITKGNRFITLFIGLYDKEKKELTYVNAAHNPPVLLHKGEVRQLGTGCTILGMFETLPFVKVERITFEEEAVLFNYTDGLTDVWNEKEETFDLHFIEEVILKNPNMSMEDLTHLILEKAHEFKGTREFIDDICLFACRFKK